MIDLPKCGLNDIRKPEIIKGGKASGKRIASLQK